MDKLSSRAALAGGFAALMGAAAVAVAAAPRPAPPKAQATASMPAQAPEDSLGAGLPPVSLGGPCLRSGRPYLRAQIRGAVRLDVDLRGSQLKCEGGPRLDGSGIRMGFEGRVGNVGQVRMIFGIDGAKKGQAARELPTNLTVIFEDEKLLFATQGDGNCTVDRLTQKPVAKTRAQSTPSTSPPTNARAYRIVAHGFCIAAANDLSGRQRILVTTFDFAGQADFNTP
jgi:hypothetical protein